MEKLDCRAGFSYFTDFLFFFFFQFFVEGLSFGKFLVACYVLPSFLLYTSSKYIHSRGSIFEYLIWLWLFPRPLNTIKWEWMWILVGVGHCPQGGNFFWRPLYFGFSSFYLMSGIFIRWPLYSIWKYAVEYFMDSWTVVVDFPIYKLWIFWGS